MNLEDKTIAQIAAIIRKDWQKVNFAAELYLSAMECLSDINHQIGFDSGKSIVLYFLSNASAWRGETAKAVKLELKNRSK
jgi:hypothetical protein